MASQNFPDAAPAARESAGSNVDVVGENGSGDFLVGEEGATWPSELDLIEFVKGPP